MNKKRLTRKQAIILFCRECMGCDGHRGGKVGTPYKKATMMAKECEDENCPLWGYRAASETQHTRQKRTLQATETLVATEAV